MPAYGLNPGLRRSGPVGGLRQVGPVGGVQQVEDQSPFNAMPDNILNEAQLGPGGDVQGHAASHYSPIPYQSGADLEAARSNQMQASATPLDLNAVKGLDWQKLNHVLDQRGMSMGGSAAHFKPAPPSLSHDDYAIYADQARRGLVDAGPGSQDIFDPSRAVKGRR